MKLNFKKLGEGSPLIILHGLFGSLDNWMSLGKYWSQQRTVYLIDQRNHGQSFHFNEHSYPSMAEDLKEFIEEQGIVQPDIIGHSMGGKTAMEFAINYPDQVDKLIIVDIAPVKYEVHHHAVIDGLESLNLSEIKSRKEADQLLSLKIKEAGIRQFLLKNLYWKEKEQLAWRFNLEVLKNEILPISEYSITEGRFERKTLFIKGANSNYILPQYLSEIEAKFSNYELKEIKGAGHWVHAEKRADFVKVIDQFLS